MGSMAVPLFVAVDIVTIGSKAAIIGPVVALLLALVLEGWRWRVRETALGVASLFAVYMSFAVVTEYRHLMHRANATDVDVFTIKTQASLFRDALLANLPFSEQSRERESPVTEEGILSRFGSGLFSFANLLDDTDGRPPYEHACESLSPPVRRCAACGPGKTYVL